MKHFKIVLENRSGNIFDVQIEKYLNDVMTDAKDQFDAVETLRIWDKIALVGAGGNHIWIKNAKGQEVANIYFGTRKFTVKMRDGKKHVIEAIDLKQAELEADKLGDWVEYAVTNYLDPSYRTNLEYVH